MLDMELMVVVTVVCEMFVILVSEIVLLDLSVLDMVVMVMLVAMCVFLL
jgi:hypothetical protein